MIGFHFLNLMHLIFVIGAMMLTGPILVDLHIQRQAHSRCYLHQFRLRLQCVADAVNAFKSWISAIIALNVSGNDVKMTSIFPANSIFCVD